VLSMFSFKVLVQLSVDKGMYSYRDIAVELYGSIMSKVCELVLLFYTCGTCIGYGVLIGDTLTKTEDAGMPAKPHRSGFEDVITKREVVIATVAVLFLLPLSLFKNMDPLKYTSFVALACIVYTFIVLAYHFSDVGMADDVELFHFKPSLMVAFPLFVVSFTAHYGALGLYKELKHRSASRMDWVIYISCTICLSLYAAFAYIGYFQFGAITKPDILNTFSNPNWVPIIVARASFGLVIIFSYPLVHNAVRKNLHSLLFNPWDGSAPPGDDPPIWRLRALTLGIVLFTNAVAIIMPNIGVVLSFNGCLGVVLVYIIPGMLGIRALSHKPFYYYGCWVLVLFGAIAGSITLVINIILQTPYKSKFE